MNREDHHKLAMRTFRSFYKLADVIYKRTGHKLVWTGKKLAIGIPEKDEDGNERLMLVSKQPWIDSLRKPKRKKRLKLNSKRKKKR